MPFDYQMHMNLVIRCCFAAENVYKSLFGKRIPDPNSHCFQVPLDGTFSGLQLKNLDDYKLSISVAPDRNDWYIKNNSLPKCVETALFKGGRLIYDEDLDYHDVNSFYNEESVEGCVPEIIEEIKRVENLLHKRENSTSPN